MAVDLSKQSMVELAEIVSKAVVATLKESGLIGRADNVVSANCKSKSPKTEKTAYQKTEQLLFNYNGFLKIVEERKQEIADLRKYGVPGKSACAGGERVQTSRNVQGLMTFDESVEIAVTNIEKSFEDVNKAIRMVDSALDKIKHEPYYNIISLFYFNGCTLEDIGVQFGCDHSTISRNKNKLVKAMSMWLFPNDVAKEYFS